MNMLWLADYHTENPDLVKLNLGLPKL